MKLKYHRLITVLTELALVCLVFVTIAAGISAWNEEKKIEYVKDGLVAWYDGTNNTNGDPSTKAELWKDLTGNENHISASDSINRVEIQTDESGKTHLVISGPQADASTDGSGNNHSVIIDSQVEAVTDENGKVYYVRYAQPDLDKDNNSEHVTYSITYIINSACYVLACVLLLLYALKFYNHSNASNVMGLVFVLPLLVAAINLCFNLSRNLGLVLVITDLLQITLFALMAALALKNKLPPKVSLIAMIFVLANTALPIISGTIFIGDILNIITNLLNLIGLASFTVAWFLCSFKEPSAAPSEEATEPVAPAAE